MTREARATFAAVAVLVALGASAADTPKMGASQYGPLTPGSAACRAGQYLAGVNVYAAPQISNMGALCGDMESDGGWKGAPAIGPATLGVGATGGDVSRMDLFCPRDYWVWGYKGFSQTYGINGITQLTLTCRNVKTGATTALASPYVPGVSQLEWPAASCDQSSVATGVVGTTHDGDIIQLGLSCALTRPAVQHERLLSAPVSAQVARFATPTPTPSIRVAASEKASAAVRAAMTQTFAPPTMAGGARLHACQTVGGQPCGQAVADAFCKAKGFARALAFTNGAEKVHSETIGGQRCLTLECNVFQKIECAH